jgi:hypothetical protein
LKIFTHFESLGGIDLKELTDFGLKIMQNIEGFTEGLTVQREIEKLESLSKKMYQILHSK